MKERTHSREHIASMKWCANDLMLEKLCHWPDLWFRSWIDVLVIDIYTPDKFYVRVDEFKSAFIRMENELQEFYNANASNRDLMPQNCPQEMSNLTCAVKADWGAFHCSEGEYSTNALQFSQLCSNPEAWLLNSG